MQYIKLNHRVIESKWHEASSRWKIKIEDVENNHTFEDECDVLLSATGILK